MSNSSTVNKVVNTKRGLVTLPMDIWEKMQEHGMHMCVNRKKSTRGYYYSVMVLKKLGTKYAFRENLARMVADAPKGKHVDHIDRNPLNNARDNLRVCTQAQNAKNRSKSFGTKFPWKGVHLMQSGYYYGVVRSEGIRWKAGPFKTEEEAARAYDELAAWRFGEFAALNFPENK